MMQHSQGTTSQQSQQHQRQINGWLMGEGWQVGEEHDDKATWLLTANDRRGRTVIIVQPRDKADVIIIQAGTRTDDNVRRRLSAMEDPERRQFYFDLQTSLLQMGVEYVGAGHPFELIVVVKKIYSDALTRDNFLQRVILVRNAVLMVAIKIATLMNEALPAPTEPSPIGFHPAGK